MKVDRSTVLPCTLEQAVANVMKTRLLLYVAHPMISFSAHGNAALPETWTPGTYRVSLRLFGIIPLGPQAIVISLPEAAGGFALRDAGHSALIRSWDHLITIEPVAGGVRYRDRVEVRAGLLTPLVWAFAQVFFWHRQRRWRRIAERGFDYRAA